MNKTGLITKISIKYVFPTRIWRISRYFAFFGGISRDFTEIPEFHGSATARNIRRLSRTHFPFFKDSIFAKKILEFTSFLVLPQHEEFYPEGLSPFAPFHLQKVSTKIQGLSSTHCNFQGLSRTQGCQKVLK